MRRCPTGRQSNADHLLLKEKLQKKLKNTIIPTYIPKSDDKKRRTVWNGRQLTLQQKGLCMSSISDPDIQALQGAWEQTSLEDSGVLNPIDAHSAPGALTTISGDRFEVKTVSGEVLLAGRFFLDSSTVPKSITWVDALGDDAGKHLPASYRLEGDSFVFIAADEGMPRPIVFSTGPGQTMRTFVRRA